MEPRRRGVCLLTVALVAAMALAAGEAKLSPGHYRSTCPRVESIVRSAVARKVRETFVTVPATLRLFFHDCFVQVRQPAGEIDRSVHAIVGYQACRFSASCGAAAD